MDLYLNLDLHEQNTCSSYCQKRKLYNCGTSGEAKIQLVCVFETQGNLTNKAMHLSNDFNHIKILFSNI